MQKINSGRILTRSLLCGIDHLSFYLAKKGMDLGLMSGLVDALGELFYKRPMFQANEEMAQLS